MAYTTIDKPDDYFNTVLYAGSSSTQSITGVGFQPDFTWIKNRTSTPDHMLNDVIRGAGIQINSNTTSAELVRSYFQSFDSDGFSLDGNVSDYNQSGSNFASWNWLANGAGVSNTAGSITSTVSANTTSGFSIVGYTGNRTPTADQSIGHGLGAVPSMMIVKNRSNGSRGWRVYHKSLGTPDKELILNSYAAVGTDTATWGNTTPTSSVFYVGASGETNTAGENYIAYCFADVKGFSKFGSYTGNGSSDGTFVYTGFKPSFFLGKNSSNASENWFIFDNKRDPFNTAFRQLFPNSSNAEGTNAAQNIDIVSNGFKMRSAEGRFNESGSTIIYMAFAENPFVTSTSIPTTAR